MAEDDWFDRLTDLVRDRLNQRTRAGFYIGQVTNALQTFRRADVEPEWLKVEKLSLEKLTRISSPILDVIYKSGTRVAVVSHDGIPEAGAVIGAVTDDQQEPDSHTVWIRVDLETAAKVGFLEIGGTQGIRIAVGANPGDLTPISAKDIELDPDAGGEVRLGAGASDWIALSSLVETELAALWTALNAHTHPTTPATLLDSVGSPCTGTTAPSSTTGSAGDVSSVLTKSE